MFVASAFFGQTFELFDLVRVSFLIVLELLLSADNAIVIGLLIRRLPTADRKKALLIGTLSAFVFRGLGILVISFLFHQTWIQLVGALYLIYLSISHLRRKKHEAPPSSPHTFWKTVFLIEFLDIAFAIDSIVAAIAFVSEIPFIITGNDTTNPKLWIVYIGAFIGLVAIRSAAHFFSELIGRFPRLEMAGYLMIGWIGLKLGVRALGVPLGLFESVFWIVLVLLFLFGLTKKRETHG